MHLQPFGAPQLVVPEKISVPRQLHSLTDGPEQQSHQESCGRKGWMGPGESPPLLFPCKHTGIRYSICSMQKQLTAFLWRYSFALQ